MKNILFVALIITLLSFNATAQPGKKPNAQNPAVQAKLNEEMEKAMKNMTPAQREQMKKMMGNVMPAMLENANEYRYPTITNNRELLDKKDIARINAIPKKKLTQADIPAYANNLFSKIMAKGDAAEIAIIKSVMAKGKDADYFGHAAILCMMQGHAQAAMGLGIKAVQTDPSNANCQNNMASLLTQYGYAEQAIPVLQKLSTEFNDNSTVLNNLAQAWLGLGATDSARVYSMAAIKSNPLNADAQVCGGVLDEADGNAEEAIDKYTKAIEQSPDPFTEKLLQNSAGQNGLNNIDYDKLKGNITIYAYFPKDWCVIPELSDNVASFEDDNAVKNGYAKMFLKFKDSLKVKLDLSKAEINNLVKKGSKEFAAEMMKEGVKNGTSFISQPARIIYTLIILKLQKLSQEYATEKQKLDNLINKKIQEKISDGKNDECAAQDRRNNQFLQEVNPMLRKFFEKHIEEYRTWLNAFCTWTWYHTGNIKNMSMTECLSFTSFYAELYRDAIAAQRTALPACKEGVRGDRETPAPMLNVPGFNCPTVVVMPTGLDWHTLDNALKNLDANSLDIKKAAVAPIPNMSIALGAGGKQIAQPGKVPFTKTANGSMLPQYGGGDLPEYSTKVSDQELNAAIDKKLGELIGKILQKPQTETTQKEVNDAIDKKAGEMIRKNIQRMLNGMMMSDCDELKNMKESDRKKKLEETLRKLRETQTRSEEFEKWEKIMKSEEYKKWDENQKKWAEDLRQRYERAERLVKDWIAGKGPAPSLSSSVQAPGTFTPQQNLFK